MAIVIAHSAVVSCFLHNFAPDFQRIKERVMKTLDLKPKLFSAIKKYNKQTLMADIMAGVIVGIVALPLAIAFGIASGVSPEK